MATVILVCNRDNLALRQSCGRSPFRQLASRIQYLPENAHIEMAIADKIIVMVNSADHVRAWVQARSGSGGIAHYAASAPQPEGHRFKRYPGERVKSPHHRDMPLAIADAFTGDRQRSEGAGLVLVVLSAGHSAAVNQLSASSCGGVLVDDDAGRR
ncbi:hypothetical protein [Bradyrhizobium genosp. P]|uniref:hypothetical protein n=1 Tax=Bradyrhizobium genosp. P TaxID=83641 RepID=UPI003CF2C68F